MIRSDSTTALEDSFEQIEDSSTASGDSHSSGGFDIVEEVQPLKTTPSKEKKKEKKWARKMKEMSVNELIALFEARFVSVIEHNHAEINVRINELSDRLDHQLADIEKKMISNRDSELEEMKTMRATLKQEAKINEAIMSELKGQMREIKEKSSKINALRLTETEPLVKVSEEKKEEIIKSSKRQGAEEVKARVCERLGKIRTMCKTRLPFAKSSAPDAAAVVIFDAASDDGVVVAAEALADDVVKPRSVVVSKSKKCTVNFRSEGKAAERRWFIESVIEPPPCALAVGDEVITIGGVSVAGVSLQRIKELVAALPEAEGIVEVK